MPDATITNPAGAYRQVSDYTTWVGADGLDITFDQMIATYRANAAVAKGDAVMFVAPTATVPLSVTGLTGSSNAVALSFAGIALDPAPVGGYARICTWGYCRAQVGTATPAAYDAGTVNGSATGALAVVGSAALAAANIAGTLLGVFLAAKDGTNMAPFRIGRF